MHCPFWDASRVFCRAVQELHECLTSIIQSGDMLDLKKLDVAEKDPTAPTSEGRTQKPMPRVDPPVGVTTPSKLRALEPEEAAPSQELTLCQDGDHCHPLDSPSHGQRSLTHPQPEQADWLINVPLGAKLDFAS